MTILHAGGEMGAFTPSDAGTVENTQGGTFNTTYTRCGIFIGTNSIGFALSNQFTPVPSIWLHCDAVFNANASAGNPQKAWSLFNAAGQELFYIQTVYGGTGIYTFNMFYWNGSGFVQIGVGVTIGSVNLLTTYDINVTFGAAGSAAFYVQGTLRDSGVAAMPVNNAAQYSLRNGSGYYSQCIASTTPTVGMKLYTIVPNANGLTDAWVGLYTDINDLIYNDGTFISTAVAGQIENYGGAAAVAGTIVAVVVTARANTQAGAPQNLQLTLNTGGIDYTSPNILQQIGFTANTYVWQTNPHTAAPWVPADINSAFYFGVKSVA